MNLMIRSILLLSLISVPAIAAVSHNGAWSEALGFVHQVTAGTTSVRAKDETRLAPIVLDDDLIDLFAGPAPTSHEPAGAADAVRIAQAFAPPPAFGGPPVPRGAFPPIGTHMGMGPPPQPARAGCEDRIDFEIAMASYFKARLRLQPSQSELWQKLESAAQGPIDKMRAACAAFPADASVMLSLPEALDAVEADMSSRAELLRITREPLRALFASLTPDQRAAMQPPVPPSHRP